MLKKKYKIILLAIVLLTFTLSACKDSQKDKISNANNANNTSENSASEAPTIKKLNYSIELQEFSEGSPKDLKLFSGLVLPYKEKDQLRFRLTSEQKGYVYLIKESTEFMDKEKAIPKYNWVFPPSKVNNLVKAVEENKLPDSEVPALDFNQVKEKEKLWLVWSDKKLMGLEMVKISLDRGEEQEIVRGSEIIDIEAATSLKNMLEKYAGNKNDKVKLIDDQKNRITNLTTSENIMTVAIELEKTK